MPEYADENYVPLDARTRAIRRRAGLTGPQPTWHCSACDAVVWLWYGRTYATREGALEARPQPPHARRAEAQKEAR